MYRNTKRALAMAVAALLVSGCEKSPGYGDVRGIYPTQNISVWVDPDTSCQYLVTGKQHITPRLHSDGVQVCMGEDKLGAQLPDYHEGEQP